MKRRYLETDCAGVVAKNVFFVDVASLLTLTRSIVRSISVRLVVNPEVRNMKGNMKGDDLKRDDLKIVRNVCLSIQDIMNVNMVDVPQW